MTRDGDIGKTFRHARRVLWIAVTAAVALWIFSGVYSVAPQQRGVVKRFGQVIDDNVQPGIHFRLPWPVDEVTLVEVTSVRALTVLFSPTEGYILTGDENIAEAELRLNYTVGDASAFLYAAVEPQLALERALEAAAVDAFARVSVDDVLTAQKQRMQRALEAELQATADRWGLGVLVSDVQFQRLDPPPGVASAFKSVASAREDQHKLVHKARGERNRSIPQARARADEQRREAKSYEQEQVARAEGDAQRFTATLTEYRKAPAVTAHRLYLETIERLLPTVKKVVLTRK